MAVNVAAMLLVFIALIAMLSCILGGFGNVTGINSWIASNTIYKSLSIEFILGYLFSPLMWIIGVAKQDIALMGQLLGIKLVASEFVGYTQLVDLKNGLNPLHFNYEKSVIMATYMLCGFANFASIGMYFPSLTFQANSTIFVPIFRSFFTSPVFIDDSKCMPYNFTISICSRCG